MEFQKKINLAKQTHIPHHNGGWNLVLKLLNTFHSEDGIFTDDIADMTFGNNYEYYASNKMIPYKQHWIGFFHHPVNIAPWYNKSFQLKPIFMISSDEFRSSMDKCLGIYTFSKSMVKWYSDNLPALKVEQLWHPTKTPDKLFKLENFMDNPRPKIINIGFFLRKLTTIFFLKCNQYEKVILVNPQVYDYLHLEISYHKFDLDFSQVKFKSYVSSDEYDELLTNNIAFLDLYDSCANNIIIECIARNTPILVNKQEAVVEYLGENYPLYYTTLEEASKKLSNKVLISETHHYLKSLKTKELITPEYFSSSFNDSDIYKNL